MKMLKHKLKNKISNKLIGLMISVILMALTFSVFCFLYNEDNKRVHSFESVVKKTADSTYQVVITDIVSRENMGVNLEYRFYVYLDNNAFSFDDNSVCLETDNIEILCLDYPLFYEPIIILDSEINKKVYIRNDDMIVEINGTIEDKDYFYHRLEFKITKGKGLQIEPLGRYFVED